VSDPQQSHSADCSQIGSLQNLPLVCPLCHGELGIEPHGYKCQPCAKHFPIHDGIPDFRVFPDPFLDFEEDRHRTETVLRAINDLELPALLEHYWSHSDITPPPLRVKYIRSALRGEARARSTLTTLNRIASASPPLTKPHRVLEIGSGTGNFLQLAAAQYPAVVGADIGMRWLHLSRRRFMDAGLPAPPLVCCCAEFLPFPRGAFTMAVCHSTLEFTREPGRCFTEAARVLDNRGVFYVNTVNRYSLARNPYAHVWGVGYLPRAWQAAYVRWRCQASYEHVRLLSLFEVMRLARANFPRVEVALPDIDEAALRQLPRLIRWQIMAYRIWKRVPVFRTALKWIAPQWELLLHKSQAPL
jgi:ubiquinone/menaquinone biosynthesis C-methylase UbiE/uncharacterized protein YbaR (Trm112 family)